MQYLILRGLMDDAWLAAANATVDKYASDPTAGYTDAADESQVSHTRWGNPGCIFQRCQRFQQRCSCGQVELGGGANPGTFILSREEVR
eukprot:COSAG04_NODE_8884_length_921_cov_0.929440_2_plen_89_part_00